MNVGDIVVDKEDRNISKMSLNEYKKDWRTTKLPLNLDGTSLFNEDVKGLAEKLKNSKPDKLYLKDDFGGRS
jgi:hypothetical protein